MPNSTLAFKMRRMFSTPCRCPIRRGSPRACAQRPFPSMMMATWVGTCSSVVAASRRSKVIAINSHFHYFFFFFLAHRVGFFYVLVGQFLKNFLAAKQVVFGNEFFGFEFFEVFESLMPNIADGNMRFFGALFDELGHFAAAFFGQGRERKADQFAVVIRRETEFGSENGFFDRFEGGSIVWLDDDEARFG